MKTFTREDFWRALEAVHIYPGDLVFVHSSLFPLGRLEQIDIKAIPYEMVRLMLDYLGEKGTLVVPTFTFAFARGMPFDRQHTPSEGMGVFSECVRLLPDSVRSFHPLQSIAAVGRFANVITSPDTSSAFDLGGPFDTLIQHGAKLLLLGATIQAASLVHYVEERVEVPYRFWKSFTGTYVDNGVKELRTYKFFARDLNLDPRLQLNPIEDWLTERNQFFKAPLGSGHVAQCTFSDFVEVGMEYLKDDPYCLVKSINR